MTGTASTLDELLTDCDAQGIHLLPDGDGGLTIDAPQDALTPELVKRIKAKKAAVLDILATSELPRLVLDPDGWPVDSIAPNGLLSIPCDPPNSKAVCRCGSTKYREIPIHNGRSTRRDCDQCGRFICFAVWYGRPSTRRALPPYRNEPP